MSPLLLPATTPHSTGVICQKHYIRNNELYEIYKKSHNLRLECGVYMQPKGERGEDAFFVDETNGRFLGLADGVGGWAQYDVDPREFPEKLMEELQKVLQEGKQTDVVDIVSTAFENSKGVIGSSTVVMAMLDKNDTLRTFNLGDSGFRVIRDFQVLYASREQQHAPNKPFQLGTSCEDTPERGVVEHIKLKAGDLLIFGSDGLFDNLFDHEIIDLIRTLHQNDMSKLAHQIAHAAFLVSIDKTAYSPYAAWVRSLGNPEWADVSGGKKDDITVIAVRVVQQSVPTPESTLHHFQNTAMTFSIDTPSLQSLLSQIKWDPSTSIRSLSPSFSPPLTHSPLSSTPTGSFAPAHAHSSAYPPLRSLSERHSGNSEVLARSLPVRAIRTEGREVLEREEREKRWGKFRNRSVSENGYFSDGEKNGGIFGIFKQESHKLLANSQSKNTGAKSNSLINSWADVIAARGGLLRHRRVNSASLRELAQSNLLNQSTEQPHSAPDPNALHASPSFSPSSPLSSSSDLPILRSVSLPNYRPAQDAVRTANDALPPAHVLAFSTTPSPNLSSSSLSLSSSISSRASLTSSGYVTPPESTLTTPRNAAHASDGHLTVARRFLAPCEVASRTTSVLRYLDTELVAARPTLRENCTEQDYFEYMVATREFEVFVNLHRNCRITILPYFI